MVSFRRWITAMAVLALFAGLASAQIVIGGNTGIPAGNLSCTATVAVPPQLRTEGMTELIGDIVLQCTGGASIAPGAQVPTANITVSLQTAVTSRLLGGSGSSTVPSNTSEALLMIDEPGSSVTGAATTTNQCGNSAVGAGFGGCVQWVNTLGQAVSCTTIGTTGLCTAFGTTPGANVFQGLVNSNQVTFNGVPINPPVTGGFARVFRITNVRANVAGLGGTGLAGTQQLVASIAISGSTSLPVSNPVLIAGFIQAGLSTQARNTGQTSNLSAPGLAQCGGGGPNALSVLNFSENFGTAFKTRVAPIAGNNGQATLPQGSVSQNVPGVIYNSESGFILPVANGTAGLADYGTRLKATFNNVPAGVRLFVSTTNITNTFLGPIASTANSFAQLVLSETAQDANGFPPLATSTTTVNSGSNVIPIAELPVVNGTATAVWEVITTQPAALETLSFGVWQQFTANPGSNSPPPGTATVTMSYAPTPGPSTFTAAAGGAASGTLTIPRFQDFSTPTNIFSIALCNTVLLFPFVTNQAGFDTGLAIANTTTDPFGTRTQNGTCTLNFYGASAPAAITTPAVNTGTVYTTLTSTSAPGFQGYMIAVCQFQLAHGFAFVSDLGAQKLAMGYLALVLPTGTGNRNSGSLSSNPGSSSVEGVAH